MKPLALFVSASPLPLSPLTSTTCIRRSVCVAKARGGNRGKKGRSMNSKKQRSQRATPPASASNPVEKQPPTSADGMINSFEEVDTSTAQTQAVTQLEGLSLPDLPKTTDSIRRRRRRRKSSATDTSDADTGASSGAADDEDVDEPLTTNAIERLTQAYRTGGLELVRQIEVEPDFMFRSGQATGEYEFAAALIGTGRPNKQGVYVTPYLQTSHMILLGVILLGTFVSYPGFPLTEGSPELRGYCKIGLGLTFLVNSLLAVYAYSEAGIRKQPRAFWCFKCFFLGNIALQELRSNAPIKVDEVKI